MEKCVCVLFAPACSFKKTYNKSSWNYLSSDVYRGVVFPCLLFFHIWVVAIVGSSTLKRLFPPSYYAHVFTLIILWFQLFDYYLDLSSQNHRRRYAPQEMLFDMTLVKFKDWCMYPAKVVQKFPVWVSITFKWWSKPFSRQNSNRYTLHLNI